MLLCDHLMLCCFCCYWPHKYIHADGYRCHCLRLCQCCFGENPVGLWSHLPRSTQTGIQIEAEFSQASLQSHDLVHLVSGVTGFFQLIRCQKHRVRQTAEVLYPAEGPVLAQPAHPEEARSPWTWDSRLSGTHAQKFQFLSSTLRAFKHDNSLASNLTYFHPSFLQRALKTLGIQTQN